MIGIVSYGAYLPRLRLSRSAISRQVGWFAPNTSALAQGEKAICNWDEDSVTMAVAASRDCLAGLDRRQVDALYLASTTLPYADRLNAGILSTALNLSQNVTALDCSSSLRAGTSALAAGLESLKAGKWRNALVAATDKRDAKVASNQEMFYGDGAAALLIGSENVVAEFKGSHSLTCDFVDHYRGSMQRFDYSWEERWVRDEGYAKIIPNTIKSLLANLELSIDQVDHLIYPCCFRSLHSSIAKQLGVPPTKLVGNLYEICGDTGTAHPFMMLTIALERAKPGERIVMVGFGQGCDALCFEVTENISELGPRRGFRAASENKKTIDNYLKYLIFRGHVNPEMGIRAEAPSQTALTTLWRERNLILGLIGGQCRECGTRQFPPGRICVNPECRAVDSLEDYEFADKPARVLSFTGDMLAVSVDPPAIYGMIEFDHGGRFMADLTDCALEEVVVGMPVEMCFRIHLSDKARGFTGYFWKAVPHVNSL